VPKARSDSAKVDRAVVYVLDYAANTPPKSGKMIAGAIRDSILQRTSCFRETNCIGGVRVAAAA
jgi:hypothetical protein